MFDYSRYLEIHRDLAVAHPQLQHIEGQRTAWLGDDSEEDKQGSRNQAPYIMMMLQVTGSIRGDEDMQTDVWKGGFEIVGRLAQGGAKDFRAAEEVAQAAFKIGREIIDRLNAMSTGEACDDTHCACVIGAFDLASVRWEKIEYKGTHTGWRFTYNLGDGEVNEYDASIWE